MATKFDQSVAQVVTASLSCADLVERDPGVPHGDDKHLTEAEQQHAGQKAEQPRPTKRPKLAAKATNIKRVCSYTERSNHQLALYMQQHFDTFQLKKEGDRQKQKDAFDAYVRRMVAGSVVTEYAQLQASDGRMFSRGASFQGMDRVLRHTLAAENMNDIDIKNAHPTLLLHYCQERGISCDNLTAFVADRDTYLSLYMTEKLCDREAAKKHFLAVMNGGGLWGAQASHQLQAKNLYTELAAVRAQVMQLEPEMKKAAVKKVAEKVKEDAAQAAAEKRNPAPWKFSVDGSCVNILMCQMENQCLMAMIDFAEMNEIEVATPCFDGLLVYKGDYDIDVMLLECSEYVLQQTGYNVVIEPKPMSSAVVVDPALYADIVVPSGQASAHDPQEHMQYDQVKQEFEKDNFKVGASYYRYVHSLAKWEVYDRAKFINVYENKWCYIQAQNARTKAMEAKRTQFVYEWLKDEHMKEYKAAGFYPDRSACPPDTFNTWSGFYAEHLPELKPEEMTPDLLELKREWLDHLKCVCEDNDEYFDWDVKRIAWMFQRPHRKTDLYVIRYSKKKGIGKTIVANGICAMMGQQHSMFTDKPEEHIFTKYNDHLEDKIYIFCDEMNNKAYVSNMDEFNSMVTRRWMKVRAMYSNSKTNVRSYNNFEGASNHVMTTDEEQRRDVQLACGDRYHQDRVHGAKLEAAYENKHFLRLMYDYFMAVDLSGVDLTASRPKTELAQQARAASVPMEVQFIDYWCFAKGNLTQGTQKVGCSELWEAYAEYLSKFRGFTAPSQKSFAQHLKQHFPEESSGIRQSYIKGRSTYTIHKAVLHRFMVDHKYMEEDEDASAVAIAAQRVADEQRAADLVQEKKVLAAMQRIKRDHIGAKVRRLFAKPRSQS